jgi:cation diffusion facilitator family transporter
MRRCSVRDGAGRVFASTPLAGKHIRPVTSTAMAQPSVNNTVNSRSTLARYAWLSIAAALITILLKAAAFWVTGSVGLLSDAAESLVNLLGAVIACVMLTIAARPADEEHLYGHSKAEYFSSGAEGMLILLAAISITVASILRLIDPQPLEQTALGLVICAVASLVNFAVARVLLSVGRQYNSITLEADARHLMTDVWTSAAVIVGVALVTFTGWQRLDPLVAIAVAINILWTGFGLIRRSVLGLMDAALPADEQAAIENVFATYRHDGIEFHALRTRQAASRRFVSVHVLVPGPWTVQRGHDVLECIEADIRKALGEATVDTHLEPVEDPASFFDGGLDHDANTGP